MAHKLTFRFNVVFKYTYLKSILDNLFETCRTLFKLQRISMHTLELSINYPEHDMEGAILSQHMVKRGVLDPTNIGGQTKLV